MNTAIVTTMPSSSALLKIRLWVYTIALLHLIFTAFVSLSIDMSGDHDPQVSAYIHIRWKLITCWFNIIALLYFPICLYCDWKELRGQWDLKNVVLLRQFKEYIMTSILFPVTLFADFLFWRVWIKDVSLIAPPKIFTYMPYWTQHSLHTVSILPMVLDLLLVPRRRPHSLWPGIYLMTSFLLTYTAVCGVSLLNGEVVYTVFVKFDTFKLLLLPLMAYIECLFFYLVQWCIVDLVWTPRVGYLNKLRTL